MGHLNKMDFLEIVPIDFSGSLGILKKEDYFVVPALAAYELGYNVTLVSTNSVKSGVLETARKISTFFILKKENSLIPYLKILWNHRKSVIFANDRAAKSFVACFFGRYNIFMSHQSRLPQKWWQLLIFKFFVRKFDAVKVSNPFEKEELIKIGVNPEKIHYIPLSIDHEFFSAKVSNREKSNMRKKLGIKKGQKVFLFLANIRKFKRVDTALKAMKMLQERGIDFKFVVVGQDLLAAEKDTPVSVMAEELGIACNVTITGWMSPKDARTIMNISDICINSSIHEGQCLVVYEAASAGLPLCVSDIGSFTSVFKKSALFHNPDDAEKLANNISEYLKNPLIARNHVRINQKIVKQLCDYNIVVSKLRTLFRGEMK